MISFALLACLFVAVSGANEKTIHVQDNSLIQEKHPDILDLTLHTDEGKVPLRLRRNTNFERNVPIITSENGELKNELSKLSSDVAIYSDKQYQASVAVKSALDPLSAASYNRALTGSLVLNGTEYDIVPTDDDDDADVPVARKRRGVEDDEELTVSKRNAVHTLTRRQADQGVYDSGAISLEENFDEIRDASRRGSRDARSKRNVKHVFGVELLIGLDNSVYNSYNGSTEEMHRDVALMIQEIDMRFDTIDDPELRIFVRLAGILIAESAADSNALTGTPRGNDLNGDVALSYIRRWGDNHKSNLPAHDHFMVITNHRIMIGSGSSSIAGLAYVRVVCKFSTSPSIVRTGDYMSLIASHELAHSLGAGHDGSTCPGFIMGGGRYRFSNCSVYAFKHYLIDMGYGSSCLSSTAKHTDDIDFNKLVENPPGQIWNPDAQCAKIYPGGYYCGARFNGGICKYLWCYKPGNGCRGHMPMRGTTCGNKKWCVEGQCVSDDKAPEVDETCMHGDYKITVYKTLTCANATSARFCRNHHKNCCTSCEKYKTGIPNCMWGDRYSKCRVRYCKRPFKKHCCQTCHGK